MPFIIHHNDDDGRCSAAIIYNELCADANMPLNHCIEYSHGMQMEEIPDDELEKCLNDHVYIVDLALDNVVFTTIQRIRNINPTMKIVHIDHHNTTFKFLESMTDEQKEIMRHVRKFYRNGISASMLCWVYACMTDTDRMRLDDENIPEGDRDLFDFTDGFSHVGFNLETPNERIIRVPMIIRFIDDWDVWRHALNGTKEFNAGFSLVENKHPMETFWRDYLYSNNNLMMDKQFINPGSTILKYNLIQYRHMMKHAFEYTLETGETILCLNADGTSLVFGDSIHYYPAVCLYNYEGDKKLWCYSMYSNEANGIDVSVICRRHGGGGHVHAAGFQSVDNIFADANK